MLKKFTQLNVKDVEINKIQSNIGDAIGPVLTNPILDFNIEKKIQLIVGDNLVNHKLNRAPNGWIVTRKRGPANLYDKQDSNVTPQTNFIINSDAIVSVDIYFY